MTELLYITDFDVEDCEAKIIFMATNEDGRFDVVLDKTCFYPRGGGQDWDMGVISKDGASFFVEEVHLDENGDVHHIGAIYRGKFALKDTVRAEVDHDRRSVNSRLHSAGHVIDMAIASLGLNWVAMKGQHYPWLAAVEYEGTWQPEKSEELRLQIETFANKYITMKIDNTLKFMPVEEMHMYCRYVPDNIPKNKPGRVVMYGDDFGIPCGGTHVKNLGQIGKINITKLKEKKGVIRISYEVEGIMSK